jgi:hypothetical protein
VTSISELQLNFFSTFGYLTFPGLLVDDLAEIATEFDGVLASRAPRPDGSRLIAPFLDQSERLCELLDDPRIVEIASALCGSDFNYLSSDGRAASGDTWWHPDHLYLCDSGAPFIKIAAYLDPVYKDTGSLRVIPGSHLLHPAEWKLHLNGHRPEEVFGISGGEVPAVALESEPGDVIVFDARLVHASFGGGDARRMLGIVLAPRFAGPIQRQLLRAFLGFAAGISAPDDRPYGKRMIETASPERMRHLQQVIDEWERLQALDAEALDTLASSWSSEPLRAAEFVPA